MWFTECLLKSPSGFANGALEVVDAGLGLAQTSPRLRMNLDLGNSDADSSQRMLNAIEPGSVVPVHRHQKTSETVVVLRGRVGRCRQNLLCVDFDIKNF